MSKNNSVDKYRDMINKPKPEGSVHEQFFGPIEKDNVNDNLNANIEYNDNLPDNVEVNVINIPIAKSKKSIRDTHKTKAFYIRNDIAKLIDKDIKTSRRGAMTEIVNALFEEYYKSQGRLK